MDERQRIEQAIAAQESLRATVGDEVVDETISMLRKKLAQLEPPVQQRKLVTILFTDIVGSTDIVKHLDPEDALEIMDGSLKRLAVPVEKHGGHIARFTGDGFKAVFGMPIAHENDPEMAIRAGLGILDAAQELGVELGTQWVVHDFQVRVGINTGLAALGGMTEAEDTVMGSSVNLAKRVESVAPPGGLLISHSTYRHVRGIFDVEPRESIKAKGFDEPIQVYRVLGIKPRAFRVRTRGVEGIETRMVGRDAELLILQNALIDAMEGKQTQVITVVGEAGVGKSRLLYEFDNRIELLPDEVRFFQGRGKQETQNLPYALLKDVFSFRFQVQESDNASEVWKKIGGGFGEIFGMGDEGKMRAHIIGQLLGFDFSESYHVKGILDDPQQIHDRALTYLGEYFEGMSEAAATVVFLEDIHWADNSSLDMLNRLARRIPGQQLLIVCVARHRLYEWRPYWGEGLAYHTRLELPPLSKQKSRGLVKEILKRVAQVPEALQELVVKGAEGNPFYIEELIKMLIEDGVIITGIDHWQVEPQRLSQIEVPATLTGVLQARLEGLPPEERTTLQQASVVGHIFWDDTIQYINAESKSTDSQFALHTTDKNLSSLRSRELIYHREESAFSGSSEYTFKHAILRDVTYMSVLKRPRKIYHGIVAEWLIQHSEDRAGEYTGLIADHLELAGKDEQAAIYLYQAGEQAAKGYDHSEAATYFNRAIDLTPENDLVGRYDLLLALEEVRNMQGDHQAQREELTAMKEIAEVLNDARRQAEVAMRQMIYLYESGDFTGVVDMLEGSLDLAQAAGDLEIEASVNLSSGMALWQQGKNEIALSPLKCALALAQEHKFHRLEADSLRVLGNVCGYIGDHARCKSYYEQALDKYRQVGDRRGEASTLNNLGVYYGYFTDHLDRSRGYFEQFLHICRKIGDRRGEGLALSNLGENALRFYNKFNRAIRYLSEALDIRQEVGDQWGEVNNYTDLGYCYLLMGEYEQAKIFYDQAMKFDYDSDVILGKVVTQIYLTQYYCLIGDFEKSESCYEKATAISGNISIQRVEALKWYVLGLLRHFTGNNQAAQEHSRQALHVLGDCGNIDLRWQGLVVLGHALTAMGEFADAEDAFQEAASLGYPTDRPRQAFEAQAGLAQISMTRGDIEQALIQIEEILAYLGEESQTTGHPLDGTIEPLRIYLTCYQVLKANNDPRSDAILTDAYNLLQMRAANISDEHLRGCFLSNVAVNREIVEEYEAMMLEGGAPP